MTPVVGARSIRTLYDVAANSADSPSFVNAMKQFIDTIVLHASLVGYDGDGPLPLQDDVLSQPPPFVSDIVARVYIHAMAEHLATLARMDPPGWSQDPSSFLTEPVFSYGRNARRFVIAETPAAFRRRLLFCGTVLDKLHAVAKASGKAKAMTT
jgi:hypothetical protein